MFDAEAWARRQPHTFYSHWPLATMTKCDYCGVYMKDHAAPVPVEYNAARDPRKVIPGGMDPEHWTEAELRAAWGDR